MDYSRYRLADFVTDSSFRQWVLQPDEVTRQQWQAIRAAHPGQIELMEQAATLVRQLATATANLPTDSSPNEEAELWQGIQQQLQARRAQPFVSLSRGSRLNRRWVAAAALLLLLGVGWWLYTDRLTANVPTIAGPAGRTQQDPVEMEQFNSTNRPLLVWLPDGSSLLLKPQSRVRYLSQFPADKRVVHLTGEAYFEVAKDSQRPFLVYTANLITKVIGTSFTVRAYDDQDATVTVRSGRVAVIRSSEASPEILVSRALSGLVLTPNQQLVVSRLSPLPARPVSLPPATIQRVFGALPLKFTFEATPVSEVFAALEKTYGLTIQYDRQRLGTCRLTADLTDEPLPEKLLIICKSIEASYSQTGPNQFAITGPGCQP